MQRVSSTQTQEEEKTNHYLMKQFGLHKKSDIREMKHQIKYKAKRF